MQKCDQQKCEILTFAGLTLAGSPYIYTRADTGGGIGDCPPPEQFQGGDCPPPENCPPPEQFRGGTAKMSPP